jgi:hypothetical protein
MSVIALRRANKCRRASPHFNRLCTHNPSLTTFKSTDNLINLAKFSGIKGAKSVTCPENRLACPGNFAVNIIVKLNNTLEEFKAIVPKWRANVAVAASVNIDKVGTRRTRRRWRGRRDRKRFAGAPHGRCGRGVLGRVASSAREKG